MKKYLFMILLISVCFGSIILESDDQIQNSIYYDSADEDSYYRIGDKNTLFKRAIYDPKPLKLNITLHYEWSSDYIIGIRYLNKELKNLKKTEIDHMENYLMEKSK
tara:strand:- start:289 stop:606 length:318 start_codon:yes stop_codon:yes gene_type:complete